MSNQASVIHATPQLNSSLHSALSNGGDSSSKEEMDKRHEALARRPSYRKILNDLSSSAEQIKTKQEVVTPPPISTSAFMPPPTGLGISSSLLSECKTETEPATIGQLSLTQNGQTPTDFTLLAANRLQQQYTGATDAFPSHHAFALNGYASGGGGGGLSGGYAVGGGAPGGGPAAAAPGSNYHFLAVAGLNSLAANLSAGAAAAAAANLGGVSQSQHTPTSQPLHLTTHDGGSFIGGGGGRAAGVLSASHTPHTDPDDCSTPSPSDYHSPSERGSATLSAGYSHIGAGGGGEDVVRKREVRLMKNREAAKECRRKKKEYVRCVEQRVTTLEAQNRRLIDELRTLREMYCRDNPGLDPANLVAGGPNPSVNPTGANSGTNPSQLVSTSASSVPNRLRLADPAPTPATSAISDSIIGSLGLSHDSLLRGGGGAT